MPAIHTPPLKAAPAHVAAPSPYVDLDEVQIESQGHVYHVRLGMPCGTNGVPALRRIVRVPSNKLTLFLDCDGSTGVDVLPDAPTETVPPLKK